LYSVGTIHDRLQANAHPVQLPIGAEDQFSAIIDLIEMKTHFYGNDLGTDITIGEIPEEHRELAEEYREKLIEAVAEVNEDLMENTLAAKKSALLN
jgi:elongation factor G